MHVTKQVYKYDGIVVHPIRETLRRVAGGWAVDVRVDDPKSTITFATVNAYNVIDRQGKPYKV